jgi:hypothetical protein
MLCLHLGIRHCSLFALLSNNKPAARSIDFKKLKTEKLQQRAKKRKKKKKHERYTTLISKQEFDHDSTRFPWTRRSTIAGGALVKLLRGWLVGDAVIR